MLLQNCFVYTVNFSLLGAVEIFYNRKADVIRQLICTEPPSTYPISADTVADCATSETWKQYGYICVGKDLPHKVSRFPHRKSAVIFAPTADLICNRGQSDQAQRVDELCWRIKCLDSSLCQLESFRAL